MTGENVIIKIFSTPDPETIYDFEKAEQRLLREVCWYAALPMEHMKTGG